MGKRKPCLCVARCVRRKVSLKRLDLVSAAKAVCLGRLSFIQNTLLYVRNAVKIAQQFSVVICKLPVVTRIFNMGCVFLNLLLLLLLFTSLPFKQELITYPIA